MPINVARTITFKVPLRNLHETERLIAFYMPWRGCQEVYWLVPLSYVVGMKPVGKWHVRLTISQAYFEVPTGPTGWRRDWQKHAG